MDGDGQEVTFKGFSMIMTTSAIVIALIAATLIYLLSKHLQ